MQRTGLATVQWLVGIFCAVIGTLMLVAPHQFAAAAYSALKPHLPLWGAFFLLGGVGLLAVAARRPGRPLVIIAHVWAGLALVSLAGGFIASSHLPGISNYAILGLGTIAVSLMPRAWRERALIGQDSFATVLGTAMIANGCYMLFWPAQYVAPIFDLVRPYLIPFGLGLVAGGLSLIAAQLRPNLRPAVRWGAYLLPATVLLVYFTRGPLPYGSWTGTAYYGGFGVVLALLPWLGPRLRRIDAASLRVQLALALIAAATLPLIGAAAFIADLQERAVTERELTLQQQQAQSLAQEIDKYLGRHTAAVDTLATAAGLAELPPTAQLDMLVGLTQAHDGELSFALIDSAGAIRVSNVREIDSAVLTQLADATHHAHEADNGSTVENIQQAPGELPILVAHAPLRTITGEYAGQVVGVRDRERLVSLLAGASRDAGGRAYVVDGAGQLVVHAEPRSAAAGLGLDRSQAAPVRALLDSDARPGALIDHSATVPEIAGYAPVVRTGWGVVVTRPAQTALASMRAGRETVAWVLLLIVAAAAGVGVAVAARLARPLGQLTDAVRHLTDGDSAAPLPDSRITEVAHLSSSFAEMRDRLADRTADLQLALSRAETLRDAGAALVAATDRERIYQAAVESALALAGASPDARATLVIGDAERATVVAAAGDDAVARPGDVIDVTRLSEPLRLSMEQRRVFPSDLDAAAVSDVIGYRPKLGEMVLTPLMIRDELRGALIVASDHSLADDCMEGLATLAAEVALALESAALTEDLHRRRSEARFRSLVRGSSDIIMLTDADGVIQYASPSTERILGYAVDDLVETHLGVLAHPHDVARLLPLLGAASGEAPEPRRTEWRVRRRDGQWLYFETIGTNLLQDPDVQGVVLNSRDVSERHVLEEQLKHQAFHDPLTRLPNRVLFVDRLEHALTRRGRRQTPVAVLFLDLDNFKVVNDSLGHQLGDQLLIAVAGRLQLCLRPEDTVARFGGDEMAVLLEDIQGEDEAIDVANRIQQRLRAPFVLDGREVFTSASIGVALSTLEHDSPDALIRDADVALYRAKAQGKARHAVFDPSMDALALERLELETDLRHAIERDELRVHYQPIVDLVTGRVCEIEALVRWAHPKRGTISPLQFIPLAEETGLILPIGRWVLTEAARHTRLWQLAHPSDPPLMVSVNISARQLQDPLLLDDIAGILLETALDPATLRLEITESVVMDDAEQTSALLRSLKRLGIELAIDDFGTGYSSLSYLNRFTIDAVKIDRSFVAQIGASNREMSIVKAIVALARSLDLSVTAEGIETAEQLEHLRALGCDRGQGYLLARPSPPEIVPRLLVAQHEPGPPPCPLRPTG